MTEAILETIQKGSSTGMTGYAPSLGRGTDVGFNYRAGRIRTTYHEATGFARLVQEAMTENPALDAGQLAVAQAIVNAVPEQRVAEPLLVDAVKVAA